MINVSNANYADCNGLYRYEKKISVDWAPLKPVYKHLTKNRYVFWATWDEYPSGHRSEWVIGNKNNLSPGGYFYMTNIYPRSGLKTTWPWEGVWESGTIVSCG